MATIARSTPTGSAEYVTSKRTTHGKSTGKFRWRIDCHFTSTSTTAAYICVETERPTVVQAEAEGCCIDGQRELLAFGFHISCIKYTQHVYTGYELFMITTILSVLGLEGRRVD
jgi:hypothetical protein